MDNCIDWNVSKWKCVINFDVCFWIRNNVLIYFKVFRCKDVSFNIISIVYKSNICSMIWIVFNCFNNCFNIIFIMFEVN